MKACEGLWMDVSAGGGICSEYEVGLQHMETNTALFWIRNKPSSCFCLAGLASVSVRACQRASPRLSAWLCSPCPTRKGHPCAMYKHEMQTNNVFQGGLSLNPRFVKISITPLTAVGIRMLGIFSGDFPRNNIRDGWPTTSCAWRSCPSLVN